ncbi:MAG: MATE family efflux transporter [Erysipelotrichaceae bacterium]
MNRKLENSNIVLLFRKLLPVQIFICMSSCLSGLVSGIIIGNFLDSQALTALGFVNPLNNIIGALSGLICTGSGILCGMAMGRGDKKQIDDIFSISLKILFITGIILTLVTNIFASDIAALCGARADQIAITAAYIKGLSFGYLPMIILPTLITFLQMSNRSVFSLILTVSLAAFTLIYDVLFLKMVSTDLFYIGIASSLAQFTVLVIALVYFLIHRITKFSLSSFSLNIIKDLLKYGFPGAIVGIFYSFRNIYINTAANNVAGSIAVSGMAIVFSFSGFFDSINVGVGNSVKMLSSVFVGERDSESLKNLTAHALKEGIIFAIIKIIIIFLFGYQICTVFTNDALILKQAYLMLRFYSLCMPFNIVVVVLSAVYLNEGKVILSNIMNLLTALLIPCTICAVLPSFMGINGIYISYMLTEVITIIIFYIYALIYNRKPVTSISRLLCLPENFDIVNKMTVSINSIADTMNLSKNAISFCKEKGIDSRRANAAGLCIEEMATNIIIHGFSKDRKKHHTIDVFIKIENNKVNIRLRDDCLPFDPVKRLSSSNNSESNLGLKLVRGIASDMQYQTTFGLNILNITI